MWRGSTAGRKSIVFLWLKVRRSWVFQEVSADSVGGGKVFRVCASCGCRSSILIDNMAFDQWMIEYASLQFRNWRDIQQYLLIITRFTVLAGENIVEVKKK